MNVAAYAKKFPHGCWSFLGFGCEKKRCGTHVSKPNGEWNKTAEIMMLNFAERGYPVFRATSASERGELKSKGGGKKKPFELILRTIISVNQLSIHGAVADLCKEWIQIPKNKLKVRFCESLVIPTEIPNANAISQSLTSLAQGDLLQEYERKFAELPDDQKLSKLCSDAGFLKEIVKRQLPPQSKRDLRLCRQHVENTLVLETSKHPDREG